MRVLLRDLAPGQEYALQFRANSGEEVSEWSQVQRFTTTDDVIAPAKIANLSWSQSGSSFIATWDKVVQDALGNPLRDFRDYEVVIDNTTTTTQTYYLSSESFTLSLDEHIKVFGSIQPTLRITVKARDLTYNLSVATTATTNADNPPTPSKPTVTQSIGLLSVEWDGKDALGNNMPNNFTWMEVHASSTNNFTPDNTTLASAVTAAGRKTVLSGLTYGTLYYVRLVAVNTLRRKSGPSVQSNGTPTRISGLNIENGQIGVDQINFTAKEIGGANSYYSTSQPASGMKNGDVWYDTDDKYTAYRYNGTTWVLAPEVGVVTGSKIIAGTVTADAIGTNLIITSSANIGTAKIDSANIASLDVAKLTTGVMNAELVMSGRITTALTGARTEMNSQGFYKYNSDGVPLVAVDGTQALLTGKFSTALTGRRAVIGSSGPMNAQLLFYSADDKVSRFVGYTESGGVEAMRIEGPTLLSQLTAGVGPSSFINLNSDNWSSYKARYHDFVTIGPDERMTFFNSVGKVRFRVDNTGIIVYSAYDTPALWIKDTFVFYHPTAPGYGFNYNIGGDFIVNMNERGRFTMHNNSYGSEQSGVFAIYPAYGIGVGIRAWTNGASQNLDVVNAASTVWYSLRASQFLAQSDERSKTEPLAVSRSDMLEEVLGLRVRRYHRKNLTDLDGNTVVNPREEVGFISQEASERINYTADDLETSFVDQYQTLALAVGAIQALHRDFTNYKESHP